MHHVSPGLTPPVPISPHHHHDQHQPPHDESICSRDIITSGCQPSHATYSNCEMTKCQFEWVWGLKVCRRVSNHVPLCAGCTPHILPLGQTLTKVWFVHMPKHKYASNTYTTDKTLNPQMSKSSPPKYGVFYFSFGTSVNLKAAHFWGGHFSTAIYKPLLSRALSCTIIWVTSLWCNASRLCPLWLCTTCGADKSKKLNKSGSFK